MEENFAELPVSGGVSSSDPAGANSGSNDTVRAMANASINIVTEYVSTVSSSDNALV